MKRPCDFVGTVFVCALCLGACAPLLAAGPGSPAVLLPSHQGQDAYWPSAGYGKDTFLVVWQSGRMTTGEIVGCRVPKRGGAVVDAKPFLICAAEDDQERPPRRSPRHDPRPITRTERPS